MGVSYRYAQRTKVPANQTRGEIERLLEKSGATGFMFGSQPGQAMMIFEMRSWRVKFMLPLPLVHKSGNNEREVAAETRRRWRALLLVIKAKLEAVDSGIVEFEREFMPFICTDGVTTVGDQVIPGLAQLVSGGKMPPLLGPGSP